MVNSEKWVQYLFVWGENRCLYCPSLEKGLSLNFPQNAWLILHWTWIFYIILFQALLKSSFFNSMGVSPRLCYFCTDDKQKRNDNAKKIKLPRRKTWKEFFFPAPFIFFLLYYTPIQRILRSDSKPVEMNGNLSSDLSGVWSSFFYWKVPVVDFDNII